MAVSGVQSESEGKVWGQSEHHLQDGMEERDPCVAYVLNGFAKHMIGLQIF